MVSTTGTSAISGSNGVVTNFTFPNYFFVGGDLIVTFLDSFGNVTVYTLGIDYSVTGGGFNNNAGGTVIFGSAPGTGTIVITRSTAMVQSSAFINNDAFNGPTMEAAFDRLTLITQENAARFTNANKITLVYNAGTHQVTVSVNYSVGALAYQAQYSMDGITWTNDISGFNVLGVSPITLSVAAQAANYYRIIVSSGINGVVVSNVINQ